ncbi:Starch-binding associating with outer membrane [Filimonas lacunae]|uniref:Starch-binding associating with outer membrane n=1 Tax=Filimonas lacunae TaxID=477680 RepID=A0A173MHL6_9BACT|nr:RagB/SusD family nutrient uptake outer membrane protein [Filimonas lacunae]BAV07114.1 outer membrane protein, nutrient binding [Filimonas lacunae]SIS94829.1 Starch-binding associating with outer membrane [Filimonas lacunae]
MTKLTIYLFAGCLLLTASSCNKFLDLKPKDGIIRQDYWKTKEQVAAAVNGIYASMLGSTTGDRAIPEYLFMWGETRSDNVTPGFRAVQDELDIANLNVLPTNVFTNWRTIYQTINYCNTVIELTPGVLELDNTFTQEQANAYIGEALTVRSLLYFYLVRTFKNAPLRLKATFSDEDIASVPLNTDKEILNQLVTDLKTAEEGLPVTYGNKVTDKGHATRYTANALLADVYLWMDKYTECVAECDKVINSNRFGLIQAGQFFMEVFYNGNSNESIFELQYDIQKTNPFYTMFTPNNKRWAAASQLSELVYGVDVINATPIVDCRGDNTSFRSTDFTIWKYVGADQYGEDMRATDQSIAHWIIYRYADVLLMKAEALNAAGQPLEASRLVKTIRRRANALDLEPMDSTNKLGMMYYILAERQREFAFEGKRWFDVLRNAKRDDYQNRQLLLSMAAISIPTDRQQAAFAKLRDDNSHYFPIYIRELETNKLLVQNPFYK